MEMPRTSLHPRDYSRLLCRFSVPKLQLKLVPCRQILIPFNLTKRMHRRKIGPAYMSLATVSVEADAGQVVLVCSMRNTSEAAMGTISDDPSYSYLLVRWSCQLRVMWMAKP